MAINLRPMSFQESSTTCEGLRAGLGAASFLAICCVYAGKLKNAAVRISNTVELNLFIASSSVVSIIWAVLILVDFRRNENRAQQTAIRIPPAISRAYCVSRQTDIFLNQPGGQGSMKFTIQRNRAIAGNDITVGIEAEGNEVISHVTTNLDGFDIGDDEVDPPSVSFEREFLQAGDASPHLQHK